MRHVLSVLALAVALVACGDDDGGPAEPAVLDVDGTRFELSDHDCAESEVATEWTASDGATHAWGATDGRSGTLQVIVDLDGGPTSLFATDASLESDAPLVVTGTSDGHAIRLEIPCSERDPGGGTVTVDGAGATVVRVSCMIDPGAPGVSATAVLDGTELQIQASRLLSGPASFRDSVRVTRLDTFEQYQSETEFAGELPLDDDRGLFEFDGESVGLDATVEDGSVALEVVADLECGLVRG